MKNSICLCIVLYLCGSTAALADQTYTAQAAVQKGDSHLVAGNTNKAIESYVEALTKAPQDETIKAKLAAAMKKSMQELKSRKPTRKKVAPTPTPASSGVTSTAKKK